MHFSNFLFNMINGLANKNPMADHIFIFISKYVPYILVLAVVLLYIYSVITSNKKLRLICIETIIVATVSFIISQIIGHVVPLNRPFVNDSSVNLLYYHKPDSSFPSDHSIVCLALALGIRRINKGMGITSIVLALLVGFSRVYVGHHYPLDVISGFCLALLVTVLYRVYIAKITKYILSSIEQKIPLLSYVL